MNIPTYILGFLISNGKQHGYKLKKSISEEIADFANIKLPTVYYHLEKLEKDGYIISDMEKDGKRPERFVYSVTDSGKKEFYKLLNDTLTRFEEFDFPIDTALFFGSEIDKDTIIKELRKRGRDIAGALEMFKSRKKEIKDTIPKKLRIYLLAILDHHEKHYIAELQWIQTTIKSLS
ncbi:MAG: PadR family transcriptional regulator [Candidatus Zixiibacteriota bacterium]